MITAIAKFYPKVTGNTLVRGTIWATISAITYRGTLLIAMALCARILGKEAYGQLSTVLSTIIVLEALSMFGSGLGTIKHIAEFRAKNVNRVKAAIQITFALAIFISISLALLLIVSSETIATTVFGSQNVAKYLALAAGILVTETMYSTTNSILTGLEKFKTMAFINMLLGVLLVTSIVYGACRYGIEGVIIAIAASTGIAAACAIATVMSYMREEPIRNNETYPVKREVRELLQRGLPVFLTTVINASTNWMGVSYLARHASYAEVGVFSAANQWFAVLLFVPSVIASSFLPALAKKSQLHDREQFLSITKYGLIAIVIANLPISLSLISFSDIILTFYGEEYKSGETVLRTIAIAAIAASCQNFLGNALVAKSRFWLHTLSNLLWAFAYLIVGYIGVENNYGALSLAVAAVVSYGAKTLISAIMLTVAVRR